MKKQASLAVIAAVCAALFAAPVLAQGTPGGDNMAPAKTVHAPKAHAKKPMKMKMAKAGKTTRTCMDYAWQSQDLKDCEAGKIKPPNWH